MPGPYAPIEPHEQGRLDVGDGHLVHWEVCGNPDGLPAVVLHGGPGSGCTTSMRQLFDPEVYRVVLFDQRGCGRSTPSAGILAVDLSTNTTAHLLDDMEQLRERLDIERWLVFGMSWGCTLALAYAESLPERVSGAVLAGVTTGLVAELDWLYRDAGLLFPEEWAAFVEGVPPRMREDDLIVAYHRLLHAPETEVREAAAASWTAWDHRLSSAGYPLAELPARWQDPTFQLTRARLCTHYFRANLWLEDGVLLRDAGVLEGIPGTLLTGRQDVGSPPGRAWNLARAWPGSELVLVDGAAHAVSERAMTDAVVAATDRHAARLAAPPDAA